MHNILQLPKWMDTEVAWSIGFILKYGTITYMSIFVKRPYKMVIKTEASQALELARVHKSMLNLGMNGITRTSTELCTSDANTLCILYELMYNNGKKIVPNVILDGPDEIIEYFLDGYEQVDPLDDNEIELKNGLMICKKYVT